MPNWKIHLRSTALSSLGFGLGFTAGVWLSTLIFDTRWLDSAVELVQGGRMVTALLLVALVSGVGGGVGGAIGGLALSAANQKWKKRWGYVWRGALSFGVGYALFVIPFALAVSLLAFYDLAEASPIGFMMPLWGLGALFGLVSGLIFGLLTVGRQTWRVAVVSTLGFAFSGSGLGYALWTYLVGVVTGSNSARWALLGGVFVFGAIGGGALGFLYSWLALRRPTGSLLSRFVAWYRRHGTAGRIAAIAGLVLLILLIRAVWLISPFTATRANLSTRLESHTTGTRWTEPLIVADAAGQPAIALPAPHTEALAWATDGDIFYRPPTGDSPVNVSNSPAPSHSPQLAADGSGGVHLVWVEDSAQSGGADIFYSRCSGAACAPPVRLSASTGPACLLRPSAHNQQPALAVDSAGQVMVSWQAGDGLLYSTWPAAAAPPPVPPGCVGPETTGQFPRLAATAPGHFALVFAQAGGAETGGLFLSRFSGGWSAPEPVGSEIQPGTGPEIFADSGNRLHIGWCAADQTIRYRPPDGQVETISGAFCDGRPVLAQSSSGAPKLVWFANQVENANGAVQPNAVLVESSRVGGGWTAPAIVAQTGAPVQPSLARDSGGTLHLAWAGSPDDPAALLTATHIDYDCSGVPLAPAGQAVFDVVRQEKFRPAADPVPYCHNRYDRMLYAPNPTPAVSDAPPTPNGAFDQFAELAESAQYEVVFATMWYDSYKAADNPGRVLGKAIARLYQQLKANPARYPRGITVRLLLGNPPGFAFLPLLNNQAWWLLEDLQASGVPEMRNDELGWKLEVANFNGAWPHSHTKMMVVDGQTVQSVGYNMQHSHLPVDHPSGKGKGRIDLGVQITGPAAQTALRDFDELWQNSTRIDCPNLGDGSALAWLFSCRSETTDIQHVPEVPKFAPSAPEAGDNAIAIFRTQVFHEGDEAYAGAIASAQETIDVLHINFSLDLICGLNLLIDACNYANRIEYMEALMQAIENNNVKVRILVSDVAWVGVENNIAIRVFEDELAARGLRDNVEIRYFEQDMHIKAALVDRQLLVVGSQNFHYSAWGGEGSLTEYNMTTESPAAAADFQRFFDYYWGRATPAAGNSNQ